MGHAGPILVRLVRERECQPTCKGPVGGKVPVTGREGTRLRREGVDVAAVDSVDDGGDEVINYFARRGTVPEERAHLVTDTPVR